MIKVMFVCHGNICRSPMAEFVLKHMVKERGIDKDFIINSSATSFEEIGNGIHRGTKKKLYEEGIYCGKHRAVRLEKSDYDAYDLIIAMDSNNLRNIEKITGIDKDKKVHLLLDFTDRKGESIADPWYTGNFNKTYEDICEGCRGLLNEICK
ncbi:MAG: low molecular weight protein-tyrosine-phosphatase [Clostridia bacterium]|nr:low molecular weight protein-tyrosine-phosphatase [Clostridia bacterium]